MIIWTGFGFLIAIIGFASLILAELVSESLTHNDQYYQQNSWMILVGMSCAAVLTFGLHKLLSPMKPRIFIDKETGQEIELNRSHSLFFIPLKWWPVAFVILGFIFMFVGNNDTQNKPEQGNAGQPAARTEPEWFQ